MATVNLHVTPAANGMARHLIVQVRLNIVNGSYIDDV